MKTENSPKNFLQTTQDVLSNESVKQEPCDSPTKDPSDDAQMLKGNRTQAKDTLHSSIFYESKQDNIFIDPINLDYS